MTATAAMPSASPASAPGKHCRERLGEHERRLLRDRRPALAEAPQLRPHVASQGAGGEAGEGEQQHGRGAADEQDATRCGATGGARLGERVGRSRETELAVGRGQRGLRAALPGEQAIDVPDVGAARVECRSPAVAAREQPQRSQRVQAADAAGEQHRLGADRRDLRLRRQAAGAEGDERRQRSGADDVQVHAEVVHPPQRRSLDLDDLAARGSARSRQPARAQVHVASDRIHRRELDETGAEAHVVELERSRRRLPGERCDAASRAAIERRVAACGHLPRPGDAQGALGRRQRRERVAQGQILRDCAASGHSGEKRDRHRHAGAHEQGPPGPCAHAADGECEHRARAPPGRARVRPGCAVRGGGGLVHVAGPKDTVGTGVSPLR